MIKNIVYIVVAVCIIVFLLDYLHTKNRDLDLTNLKASNDSLVGIIETTKILLDNHKLEIDSLNTLAIGYKNQADVYRKRQYNVESRYNILRRTKEIASDTNSLVVKDQIESIGRLYDVIDSLEMDKHSLLKIQDTLHSIINNLYVKDTILLAEVDSKMDSLQVIIDLQSEEIDGLNKRDKRGRKFKLVITNIVTGVLGLLIGSVL